MELEERIAQIEDRLAKIERFIRSTATQPVASAKTQAAVVSAVADTKARTAAIPVAASIGTPDGTPPIAVEAAASRHEKASPVTTILGWAGATALVLASIYLVVLAIDAGWLTPVRQLMLAMLGGFVCIGIGLLLRNKDMHYASLLPAGGIVILFLSMYGAHNYYHLIGTTFATSGIIVICLFSLWLNRLFLSELYALFAVVGSYTAPVLLGGSSYSIADLIVYFACWSILFSIFSIWTGKRNVYILAMYLALVIFDLKWNDSIPDTWIEALVFQTVHFLIFVVAASVFSIRIAPMSQESAVRHIPALALFYFVQYHILVKHVPGLAPWIAIASAAVLLASYFVVYRALAENLAGGRMLLSSYVALVLVHAGYIESVPAHWAPWVGLVVIPAVGAYAVLRRDMKAPGTPLWVAVALIFIANYFKLFPGYSMLSATQEVPAHDLLALFYAAELYLAYYFSRKTAEMKDIGVIALYAGHVAIMAWAMQIFDSRFIVSLIWGVLALGCLLLSLQRRDKILGQSSLLVFSASALKALLYDIALAAPLIRIGSLLVLGVSLYLGGWLYKKVSSLEGHD
jgi:uncharacterized membrane protein